MWRDEDTWGREERDARGWGHKMRLWRMGMESWRVQNTERRIQTGTQKDGCEGEEMEQGVGDLWDNE